jgi:hypothetical protein
MILQDETCPIVIPCVPGWLQMLVQVHGKPAAYESQSFFYVACKIL